MGDDPFRFYSLYPEDKAISNLLVIVTDKMASAAYHGKSDSFVSS